jgi:phage/plasmid primase-like uncharacterized protein
MPDHTQAFRDAIVAAGLTPPDNIVDDGKRHRFATSSRRGDGAGWYVLHGDGIPAGAFGDWRSGFSQSWCSRPTDTLSRSERDGMRQRMALIQAARDEAQAQAWAVAEGKNRLLWQSCTRLADDDLVHRYLAGRGIDLSELPGGPPACIRLHPALPYFDGAELAGHFPAMVSAIVNPSGRGIGLHRTYLYQADGRVTKASVPSAKKMTRLSASMAGACIPLARVGIDGAAGIAEGIETALACTLATGIPTLAAISAGGLARWQWPLDDQGGAAVSDLFIFSDNDANEVGQKAARELEIRARAAGIAVQTLTPTATGSDWADAWAISPTPPVATNRPESRTSIEDCADSRKRCQQKSQQTTAHTQERPPHERY